MGLTDGMPTGWSPGQQTGTAVPMEGACPHCSGPYTSVVHSGKCPKIAEIEYHQDGTVKRVKFHPPQPEIGKVL